MNRFRLSWTTSCCRHEPRARPLIWNLCAEGLAARIRLEQTALHDLSQAFAALDAGYNEQASDVLIESFTPDRSSATRFAA